jgi:amidase
MTDAEVRDLTLTDMARLIRERRLSAREALEAHLERIEQVDGLINAICTLDPEGAREAALRADERAAAGEPLPPLHGVPMTHKDSHDTAGMRTTLGSPIFAERVPAADTAIVARLKAAGVITTGKSNVPELAAGSHTYNPVFGTTTNPYDPSRSTGGSSGGVAAAIAAGIQPAGDASDMGGSIRTPASFCNLVGLRPSAGRVELGSGSDPWAWISRKGPLARTVDDLRLMMDVISGVAPDAALRPAVRRPVPERILHGDLTGLRIAYSPRLGVDLPVEKPVLAVLDEQVRHLERLGASVELADPDLSDADEVFATTRAFDFSVTYQDLYLHRRDEMKPALQWNLAQGFALTAADMRSAVGARTRLRRATMRFFTTYDLLVAPAVQVQPFDATLEHPLEIEGRPMETYLDWMRAATLISATEIGRASCRERV